MVVISIKFVIHSDANFICAKWTVEDAGPYNDMCEHTDKLQFIYQKRAVEKSQKLCYNIKEIPRKEVGT